MRPTRAKAPASTVTWPDKEEIQSVVMWLLHELVAALRRSSSHDVLQSTVNLDLLTREHVEDCAEPRGSSSLPFGALGRWVSVYTGIVPSPLT